MGSMGGCARLRSGRGLLGVLVPALLSLHACNDDTSGAAMDAGSDDAGVSEASCNGTVDCDPRTCPAEQMHCGGALNCTNLKIDRSNCGACGKACADGEACVDGACSSACPSAQTLCTSPTPACVSLTKDAANCGACGKACASGLVCAAGACLATCPSGESPCSSGNGSTYCAQLQTDTDDCGACGKACPAGSACVAGGCDCAPSLTACGDACVDLASSGGNCGRCGHDCFAGACAAGKCYPVEVAEGLAFYGVSVDSSTIYWTVADGWLRSAPVHGGATKNLARGQCPLSTVLAGTSMYWNEAWCTTGIYFAPRDGEPDGGSPTLLPGSAGQQVMAMAADSSNAYWIAYPRGAYRAPLDGGAATLVADTYYGTAFAADDANLYWSPLDVASIQSAPISGLPDGGAPSTLAPERATALVADGVYVYWATPTGVSRIPRGGGGGGVLYSANKPCALAVDATNLYWTECVAGGAVMMAPKEPNGTQPFALATGQRTPGLLAVGPDIVVFAPSNTVSQGALMRVAKP